MPTELPTALPPARTTRPYAALSLLWFLFVSFAVGALGSLAASPALHTWYPALVKPALTPPGWLFAPVWTILYAAMALAAWLAARTRNSSCRTRGLRLFYVQLLLNLTWTWVFFSRHRPGLALVEIALLWAGIALAAQAFYKISRLATGLMTAYLAWVTFAAYLNWGIWRLNR